MMSSEKIDPPEAEWRESLVKHLEKMLAKAKAGEIEQVVFAALIKGGPDTDPSDCYSFCDTDGGLKLAGLAVSNAIDCGCGSPDCGIMALREFFLLQISGILGLDFTGDNVKGGGSQAPMTRQPGETVQ